MKIGVVDVGGGLRDIYGAGVFDFCMDNGVNFDTCAGVSAARMSLHIWQDRGEETILSIPSMLSAVNI